MFGWLDCSKVDAFADGVVSDLRKRVPPSGVGAAKKAAERMRRTQDVIFDRAESFGRAERPNFYKKARLGNRVRWGLKEAGYPDEFAAYLAEELVSVITLASR
jgi:hypothetical protein